MDSDEPIGKQRRRRHLEIENILADDDSDQRDQRGNHSAGGTARPESTNIRDASRLRGREKEVLP